MCVNDIFLVVSFSSELSLVICIPDLLSLSDLLLVVKDLDLHI